MLCPHCGSRNVVGAMTCVVCSVALPQPLAPEKPDEVPPVRPEILRARRPSPLTPPSLDGLPPSTHRADADVDSDVPVSPSTSADEQGFSGASSPEKATAPWADEDASTAPPVSSSPPAVGPPSADPAVAPSGVPPDVDTYNVLPGVVPVSKTLISLLVDGVVVIAPAAVLASWTAPPASDAQSLFVYLVTALLLTPSCTAVFLVSAVILHVLHFAVTLPRFGATLGGTVAGLGIRGESGEVLGTVRAVLRGLAGGLTGALFLSGPLYALWVDAKRRGLGDLCAGTVPVRHQHRGGR